MEIDKTCPVCGKKYEYKLKVFDNEGNPFCVHDNAIPTIGDGDEHEKYRRRLDKREKILELHAKGKLSKSYYSKNKYGKPYLSPHRLYKEGY